MTEQELKEKYALYTDSWKFYRKWAVQSFPLTDEQWEQVIKEAHVIHSKYSGSKMVEYMILAVIRDLEEKERMAKK